MGRQGKLFSLRCCWRSLVSLFFSGWNKLPPTSRMMADVLKKKPPVKRYVMGTVCQDNPKERGGPMVVMGETRLGHPTLIYSLTTHNQVGKCCCGSFKGDRSRHQGHSALEQLTARPRTCRLLLPGPQAVSLFRTCQDGRLVSSRLRVPSRGFSLPNSGSRERWGEGQAPSRNPTGARQCVWGTVYDRPSCVLEKVGTCLSHTWELTSCLGGTGILQEIETCPQGCGMGGGGCSALQQLSGARRGPRTRQGAGWVRSASKAELAHRTMMKIWEKTEPWGLLPGAPAITDMMLLHRNTGV